MHLPVKTARRHGLAAVWLLPLLAACATAAQPTPAPPSAATPAASTPAAAAPAPAAEAAHHHHMAGLPPITIPAGALITEADVRFMQGMIAHHAQAMHMSKMAAERGASARLQRFAQKIDLSQTAEIVQMQEWLRAHGQFAPDTSSWRTMTMPGMLTQAELDALGAARGKEFERQFLTLMIRHHEGALKMVADLFATPRAAQDVDLSVLANDVETTQTAEIAMMYQMLDEL